jgi:preprotein translocase subunit SecD
MIESLRIRWTIILAVLVLSIVWTVPNFFNMEKHWWPSQARMILGLDIQGGSHLVLRVDVDSAIKQDAQRFVNSLPKDLMEEKKIEVKTVTAVDPLRGVLKVEAAKAEDTGAIRDFIEHTYGNTFKVAGITGNEVNIEFGELYLRDFRSKLLDQAIAVIRNRIDEFGVAEPSITAQGTDRILVQLPGIKDASTAKDLINRTARLDFMIVSHDVAPEALQKLVADAEAADPTLRLATDKLKYTQYVDKLNVALKGKLPAETLLYFEKPDAAASIEVARVPYLLKTNETVSGATLTNAQVGMDQYNKPVVHFAFNTEGTKQFADLTRAHEKEQMAIVLDKVVKSAPSITEPITHGSGQITLGGGRDPQKTMSEAKIISTALRAGALPATLEQLEERTVGPSLGADAIHQGQIGTLIAALAVFLFMAVYYKSFGIVADLSLAFNLLITFAILSSLNATLTLPGVAGLALTLGISVDASVIIFERVKEEMGKGANKMAAIREGYERAFSSIFDANVTSIAVCIVLMYYGTGPVRGFAVTLLTGLVITTFTAVFFTRAVFDLFIGRFKWNLSVK